MLVTQEACPACQGSLEILAGQAIQASGVGWFRSYRCKTCDFRVEEDGNEPDPSLREELLNRQGTWLLQIHFLKDRLAALLIVGQRLKISARDLIQPEVTDRRRVAAGTHLEMEWLRRCLLEKAITAEVVRSPTNQ